MASSPTRSRTRFHGVPVVAALVSGLTVAPGVVAQEAPETAGPQEVLQEIKELQVEFEAFRESRTPISRGRPEGYSCDEQIGRVCIWYGGEGEDDFPGELREVKQAREELIRKLFDAQDAVSDRWVLGMLVHYLVESGNPDEAERVAFECGIEEEWWCHALMGYALHKRTEYVLAEGAFRNALDAMPDEVWRDWTSMRYILPPGESEAFDRLSDAERELEWERFWRLSDPLFLFEGNDRFTDHLSRWVVARNYRDAAEPLGQKVLASERVNRPGTEWDTDLEETLVRYGMNIGYSRSHDPTRMPGALGGRSPRGAFDSGMQDTRNMTGHHHPKSRGYIFPPEFMASPSEIPPESWITAPREARTWHAPLYAPEVRGLETQVGRFRRDESMLVVGAYRPTLPVGMGAESEAVWGAGDLPEEPPHASLFLIPVEGGPFVNVLGRETEGVFTLEARPGKYVSSLEVVDLPERRAWRARQGIVQEPLVPGLVAVSDLMILREGAPLPDTFEEAVPDVRPGVRVRSGERFGVFWEVYGLRIREPVRVTVGFSAGKPGFLERVGDFLGIIEPEQQVDITFDDFGPDAVQAIFRSIELELPDLEPGEYTLHLQLDLEGRTPVVTSRPIVVEG